MLLGSGAIAGKDGGTRDGSGGLEVEKTGAHFGFQFGNIFVVRNLV